MSLSTVNFLALDNWAILMQASNAGLKIYPEDLYVGYSEIDWQLTSKEDAMISQASKQIEKSARGWLTRIRTTEDVTLARWQAPDDPAKDGLDLAAPLSRIFLNFAKLVWTYGQDTAGRELDDMEVQTFAAGKGKESDLTNVDAFEWYDLYMRELAKGTETAVFHYMQPIIIEYIQKGMTGEPLAEALAAEFARYGRVRTQIIARTESNKAFNWGRRWRFDQSPALAGYRYSAILDERTTEICKGLHGHSWKIGDPELDQYTPPNHYQCRSVLVPINKYRDWKFNPHTPPWENHLPEKEKSVLHKFKDSMWYPKRKTVQQKKVPAIATSKGQAKKEILLDREREKLISDLINRSITNTKLILQKFVRYNMSRGASVDMLANEMDLIDEIESGKYDVQMIHTEWNGKERKMELQIYDRLENTGVFIYSGLRQKNTEKLIEEIRKIANDPLFIGVKFKLRGKISGGVIASYNFMYDLMTCTTELEGISDLYHEIGHRVHNIKSLYELPEIFVYDIIGAAGITISDMQWEKWMKTVDSFWDPSRTPPGSDLLPDDMVLRWEYPINAKFYYKNGTKRHFYMEMFAESTSVYLENDQDWVSKVQRVYPGLLEYMERVFKRGYIVNE